MVTGEGLAPMEADGFVDGDRYQLAPDSMDKTAQAQEGFARDAEVEANLNHELLFNVSSTRETNTLMGKNMQTGSNLAGMA